MEIPRNIFREKSKPCRWGGGFGRDDVVLLQRFAVQCGVSLRNAGGVKLQGAGAPTGAPFSRPLRFVGEVAVHPSTAISYHRHRGLLTSMQSGTLKCWLHSRCQAK